VRSYVKKTRDLNKDIYRKDSMLEARRLLMRIIKLNGYILEYEKASAKKYFHVDYNYNQIHIINVKISAYNLEFINPAVYQNAGRA